MIIKLVIRRYGMLNLQIAAMPMTNKQYVSYLFSSDFVFLFFFQTHAHTRSHLKHI